MKFKVLVVIMIAFFHLLRCGQRQVTGPVENTEPAPGYLSGDWDVHHLDFRNVVFDTSAITIFHIEAQVAFVESTDTISTGTVIADTIRCSDMYGLGISRIFIDDADHMHSELPMCESSNGIKLIRQSE